MSRAAGAASELLVQSLTETAAAMRGSEARCRGAYAAPGPLRAASLRLADAYARAAEVFEQELGRVGQQIADEAVGVTASGAVVHRVRSPATEPTVAEWARDVDDRVRQQLGRCPECKSASRGRTPGMFCQNRWHDTPKDLPAVRSIQTTISVAESAPPELDLDAMNSGRAAVGMPPLSIERLPAPPPELVLDPPEFPEGCKPTAKCASGRLVYCKNCGGSTERGVAQFVGQVTYEVFACNDCRATTYVLVGTTPRLRCPGGMALCPACGGAKPRVGPNRCWEGWHDLPAHTGHDFEQVSGGHCGVCGYGHK